MLLWWSLVLRSVLVLGLAIAFFASGTNRPLLANLMGTYWLIGALLTLAWARRNRGARGSRVALAAGAAGVVAAAILLARSLIQEVISLDTALAILGVAAILTGALRIAGAFHSEEMHDLRRPAHRIVLGLSEIGIGVVWIAFDEVTSSVATAAGLWALVGGTIMLADALAMRKALQPDAGAP
jgi:uncharacterized membrane protein HdeD (DUF308 family)